MPFVVDSSQFRATRRWALVFLAVAVLGIPVYLAIARPHDTGGGLREPAETPAGEVGSDFHSLVADPSVSGRLFVGGHQTVSVSNDGGFTWSRVTALNDADAMGWAFDAEDVWVSGHPGISHSSNGGADFALQNSGLPRTDIHALGGRGDRIYAARPGVGFIASADGGQTWLTMSSQSGEAFFGRILVGSDYAAHVVAADTRAGVVESTNGGQSWRVLTDFTAVWLSTPDGMQTIYASGPGGAVRSRDGGTTWAPMVLPAGASLVEGDPRTPNFVYAGQYEAGSVTVWFSSDWGASWVVPSPPASS